MTDNDYLYFSTLAKFLNFSEAAKHLYISQPALSKQINKIEREFGTMLFIRTKHEVKITAAGKALLEGYKSIQKSYDEVKHLVQNADKGNSGKLQVGIQDGQMVEEKMNQVLISFQSKYPLIDIQLSCIPYKELMEKIDTGDIDLAITLDFSNIHSPTQHSLLLEKVKGHVVISSSLIPPKRNFDWNKLNQMDILIISPDIVPNVTESIYTECRINNIFPKSIKYAPTYSTLFNWIIMKKGFAILAPNIWTDNSKLTFLPLLNQLNREKVVLWNKNNNNPSLTLFLNHISWYI